MFHRVGGLDWVVLGSKKKKKVILKNDLPYMVGSAKFFKQILHLSNVDAVISPQLSVQK